MAYATVKDLESRWRPLTPSEYDRANVLLEDAAAILGRYDYGNDDLLRIVSCNMVRRAMTTDGDAFGLDGQTFPSEGWASDLSSGDLYITAQERRSLSRNARIGSVEMVAY